MPNKTTMTVMHARETRADASSPPSGWGARGLINCPPSMLLSAYMCVCVCVFFSVCCFSSCPSAYYWVALTRKFEGRNSLQCWRTEKRTREKKEKKRGSKEKKKRKETLFVASVFKTTQQVGEGPLHKKTNHHPCSTLSVRVCV